MMYRMHASEAACCADARHGPAMRENHYSNRERDVWCCINGRKTDLYVAVKEQRTASQFSGVLSTSQVKGALYIIWCGVNRLSDSGLKVM